MGRLRNRVVELKSTYQYATAAAQKHRAKADEKMNDVLGLLAEAQQENRELTGEIEVLKVEREGMVRVNETLISRFDSMIATNIRLKVDAESQGNFQKTDPV